MIRNILLAGLLIAFSCKNDEDIPTTRTYRMGFQNSAPRIDNLDLFIQSLNLWTQRADAYELFYRTASTNQTKARLQFSWNVIRFFKWSNIKQTKNNYSSTNGAMFKSYLIAGFRNAIRHRLNSSINILGLSLALGIAITSFIIIDNQFTPGMIGLHTYA